MTHKKETPTPEHKAIKAEDGEVIGVEESGPGEITLVEGDAIRRDFAGWTGRADVRRRIGSGVGLAIAGASLARAAKSVILVKEGKK